MIENEQRLAEFERMAAEASELDSEVWAQEVLDLRVKLKEKEATIERLKKSLES